MGHRDARLQRGGVVRGKRKWLLREFGLRTGSLGAPMARLELSGNLSAKKGVEWRYSRGSP